MCACVCACVHVHVRVCASVGYDGAKAQCKATGVTSHIQTAWRCATQGAPCNWAGQTGREGNLVSMQPLRRSAPWVCRGCLRDRDRCCAPCVCVIAGLRAAASLSGARAVDYPKLVASQEVTK